MYNTGLRGKIISLFAPVLGGGETIKDSLLLQTYATLCEMFRTKIPQPQMAYAKVREQYASCRHALSAKLKLPAEAVFTEISRNLREIPFEEFLIYVVPGIACDPKRVVAVFRKQYPQKSDLELTHHIIQIRYLVYQMEKISSSKQASPGGYDDILDKLYDYYQTLERNIPLPKSLFLQLYSAINTFQLEPQSLAPHTLGFKEKDITELMQILTDELQMTRQQQVEMIARYFVYGDQASQIVYSEKLHNYIVCKDEKLRIILIFN